MCTLIKVRAERGALSSGRRERHMCSLPTATAALIHRLKPVQNMRHGLNAVKIIRHARGLIRCKLRDMWWSELEWKLFWAAAPYDEVLTDQVLRASESKWAAAVFNMRFKQKLQKHMKIYLERSADIFWIFMVLGAVVGDLQAMLSVLWDGTSCSIEKTFPVHWQLFYA